MEPVTSNSVVLQCQWLGLFHLKNKGPPGEIKFQGRGTPEIKFQGHMQLSWANIRNFYGHTPTYLR